MARRAEEIAQEVNSMTTAIGDFALQINNSTAEMLALAEIEKVYQDRVKKAQELDATHLIYLADVEKTMATLGYRVGVLRNATQAFAQSVTQFLDAVSTEGFTLYQKVVVVGSLNTNISPGVSRLSPNIVTARRQDSKILPSARQL